MADQVPDLPPSINGNFRFILIGSYSEISDRPSHRSSGRSTYPPENGNLRFILIDSYSEKLRQTSWQIYPQENGNLRFILIDSYPESSGRPGGRSSGRSYLPLKQNEMTISDSY